MKKKTKPQLLEIIADITAENKQLKDDLEGSQKAFKECWKRAKYYQDKYEELKVMEKELERLKSIERIR